MFTTSIIHGTFLGHFLSICSAFQCETHCRECVWDHHTQIQMHAENDGIDSIQCQTGCDGLRYSSQYTGENHTKGDVCLNKIFYSYQILLYCWSTYDTIYLLFFR